MHLPRRIVRLLGHFHDQEAANGATDQRSDESKYNDRQSMFPFAKKEQRLETLTHDGAAENENNEATQQRELVR